MDPKTFVLENIPVDYGEDFVKDYIEGTLDIDVKEVKVYPYIQRRALFFLEEPLTDFPTAAKMVQEATVASQTVRLLRTRKKPAVVAHDVDFGTLSKDFLQMYFESSFAAGEDVVETCETWPEYNVAVVHFLSEAGDVASKILAEMEHVPLPSENCSISVSPFYKNFHELIGKYCEASIKVNMKETAEGSSSGIKEETSQKSAQQTKAGDRLSEAISSSSDSESSDEKVEEIKRNVIEKTDQFKMKLQDETEDSEYDSEAMEEAKEEKNSSEEESDEGAPTNGKKEKKEGKHNESVKEETDDSEDDSEDTDGEEREDNKKKEEVEDVEELEHEESEVGKEKGKQNVKTQRDMFEKGSSVVTVKKREMFTKDKEKDEDEETDSTDEESDTENKNDGEQNVFKQNRTSSKGGRENQQREKVMAMAKKFDRKPEKTPPKNKIETLKKGKHKSRGRGGAGGGGGGRGRGRRGSLDIKGSVTVKDSDEDRRIRGKGPASNRTKNLTNQGNSMSRTDSATGNSSESEDAFASPTPRGRGHKNHRGNIRGRGSACIWVGSKASNSNAFGANGRKSSLQNIQATEYEDHSSRSQSFGNIHQRDTDNISHRKGFSKETSKSFEKADKSDASKKHKPKPIYIEHNQSRPEEDIMFKVKAKEYEEKKNQEIRKLEEQLKKMREENSKLKEAPQGVKETLDVSELQSKFLSEIFQAFEKCHCHYDVFKKEVVLEGPEEIVREYMLKLMIELRKIKEDLFALSPGMQSLLSSVKGKQYLDKFSSQVNDVHVVMQENALVLAAKGDEILNAAMDKLKNTLNFHETLKTEVKIPDSKLKILQAGLQIQYLVALSWTDEGKKIIIEGFRDDVLKARKEVEALIEDYDEHEVTFCVKEPKSKFFCKCLGEKIIDVLKDVKVLEKNDRDSLFSIRFKGKKSEVNQAHRNLQTLETKIMSRKWDLQSEFSKKEDLMLISKNLQSDSLKDKLQVFELKERCLVNTSLPDSSIFKVAPRKAKQITGRQSKTKKKSAKAPRTSASRPSTPSELIVNVTPTCQLSIKPYGNIIKEASDVLVCVLADNVDLRKTRVGQAFNKVCPSLWKSVKAEKELNTRAAVLTTMGPFQNSLQCQAICHIILTPWDASSSPSQLSNAITQVLQKAAGLGAKSVSFPALGCGRAFGFPESNVAQTVITTIKSMSNSLGSLSNLVFLAPDPGLFKELNIVVPKHFSVKQPTAAAPPVVSDTSSSAEDSSDDDDDDSSGESDFVLVPDSQVSGTATVAIVTLHGNKPDNLWSKLKKEIEKNLLHIDYFNQELMDFWPKGSRNNIVDEAKKRSVWVERSNNPKTKKPGFMIKGERHAVESMKSVIQKEFFEVSQNVPKKRILSGKAKRGTVEFMIQASESDEPFPSYWELNKSKSFLKKTWDTVWFGKSSSKKIIVDVDKKTKDAITKLVAKTWDAQLVGAGNDARGLNHKSLKVLDVKRIENPGLFEVYCMHRKWLFQKMIKMGHICPDIGKLPGSKGRVASTDLLDSCMKEELYYEVNEHYLFHGTKGDIVGALAINGLDPKVSSDAAMFGKGIYAAERSTKSDQYTDPQSARTPAGTKLTLFLARMLLGNVFLCNNSHPSVANKQSVKLNRPPCMKCQMDKCKCKDQALYDSVMGDGSWLFREFVVYEKSHCYPEYIITYQRVP